jgi:hypothetical protein
MLIEEHDPPGYLVTWHGGKLSQAFCDDEFRCDPVARSGDTQAPKSSDYKFLGCTRHLAGVLDEFATVFTSYPSWYAHFFEVHVKAELAQFFGDIRDCGSRLQRTNRSRTDVVREVSETAISIIVTKGR